MIDSPPSGVTRIAGAINAEKLAPRRRTRRVPHRDSGSRVASVRVARRRHAA